MAPMTVSENIWIGREPLSRLGFVDHAEMNRRTAALFDRLGIDIDPEVKVGKLSVASRQMVEIARPFRSIPTSSSWTSRHQP